MINLCSFYSIFKIENFKIEKKFCNKLQCATRPLYSYPFTLICRLALFVAKTIPNALVPKLPAVKKTASMRRVSCAFYSQAQVIRIV